MKKLVVFDFDGTLFHTMNEIEGKKLWLEKTGDIFPYNGWWSKAETLDMDIFQTPVNDWVHSRYISEISDDKSTVILATGRLEKVKNMRDNVKKILDFHNVSFHSLDDDKDGVYLNDDRDTYHFKTKLFERLVDKLGVKSLVIYDDRHEHLIKFKDWAEGKSFNVTIHDIVNKNTHEIVNVLSLEDYNSLNETNYLLSTKANTEALYKTIKDAKAGKNLIEFDPTAE